MEIEDQLVMETERFANRCLSLIARIRRTGEEVVLTARGKPVALLTPILPQEYPHDDDDERVVWDLEAVEP